jgi:hypothetical protein
VVGVTLGLGVTFGFLAAGPFSGGRNLITFAAAWATTVVSVVGTRLFVKSLNAALRSGNDAGPEPRLTKDLTHGR